MTRIERPVPATLCQLSTAVLAGLLLGGCGSDATQPRVAGALSIVSAAEQVVSIGAESEPLVVRVVDQFGSALGGALVEWAVTAGEGTVSDLSSVSNAEGEAQVTYLAGDDSGEAEVRASVAGADPVWFFLTITEEADADE